jgi:hypothetical protein
VHLYEWKIKVILLGQDPPLINIMRTRTCSADVICKNCFSFQSLYLSTPPSQAFHPEAHIRTYALFQHLYVANYHMWINAHCKIAYMHRTSNVFQKYASYRHANSNLSLFFGISCWVGTYVG